MDTKLEKVDQTLVQETIQGHVGAYDELYLRYSGSVRSMLMTRCAGDEALAEDIMQEAFIKAFVNIRQFDPQYTFGQWITTIARNQFIDHTRRRRNVESHDSHNDTPSDQPDPEQRVINHQNNRELEQAIDRLPPRYGRIFKLRYLEELSYEEIAQELSMPMGTVKTQIHRARSRFLKEMGIESFE